MSLKPSKSIGGVASESPLGLTMSIAVEHTDLISTITSYQLRKAKHDHLHMLSSTITPHAIDNKKYSFNSRKPNNQMISFKEIFYFRTSFYTS